MSINPTFLETELIVKESNGAETIVTLEDGSGFNCARGRNTYVAKYYIDCHPYGVACSPAKSLSTIVRRLEKEANRDVAEAKKITITLK